MSYCRFSSDNWKCDVYVYGCEGGYAVHVACNRIVGDVPAIPDIQKSSSDEWIRAVIEQHRFIASAEHKNIGGPLDGQSFIEPALPELLSRLLDIQSKGYNVPEWVLDEIRSEMHEEQNGQPD